jgi:hypothetical protein
VHSLSTRITAAPADGPQRKCVAVASAELAPARAAAMLLNAHVRCQAALVGLERRAAADGRTEEHVGYLIEVEQKLRVSFK